MTRCTVSLVVPAILVAAAAHGGAAQTPTAAATLHDREPYVVEQLYTGFRFENDGTGYRRMASRVRIQTQNGVRQLGELLFEYAGANEHFEVEHVRVRKASGEVVLAGEDAVQDRSSPVALDAPVYTDARLICITVPNLAVGDTLEYSVVVHTHEPLAPNQFWMEYVFTRFGTVNSEVLEVDVPAERAIELHNSWASAPEVEDRHGRRLYRWEHSNETVGTLTTDQMDLMRGVDPPDVQVTSFEDWDQVGSWYAGLLHDRLDLSEDIERTALQLVDGLTDDSAKVEALYDYVSKEIRYVSLSFGVGRYQPHSAAEVWANRYGDCKDKHTLLAALLESVGITANPALVPSWRTLDPGLPSPAQFDHVISVVRLRDEIYWLDTTAELAPFGMLSFNLRGKQAVVVCRDGVTEILDTPVGTPFGNTAVFEADGEVSAVGRLTARVRQTFRGDGELLMRSTVRYVPPEQFESLLQGLVEAQGLAGHASNLVTSDPVNTDGPFELAFDLTVPGFLDFTETHQNISATFLSSTFPPPEPGDSVFLGSLGEFVHRTRIVLPEGFEVRAPVPVSLRRDYASYESRYGVDGDVLTVERVEKKFARAIPPSRFPEYEAFFRAVNADGTQVFALRRTQAALPDPGGLTDADDLNTAGYAAFESGDLDRAIALLSRAVEIDPFHLYAWNNLGRALLDAGRDSAAVEAFERQIEINPYDEFVFNNLGMAYRRMGLYLEAEQSFLRQLDLNPLDEYANANLGELYVAIQKYPEAVEYLQRAASVDPDDIRVHMLLVEAFRNSNRLDDAWGPVHEVLRLDSTSVIGHNYVAWIYMSRRDFEHAYEAASKAVEMGPSNVESWAWLGRSAYFTNRMEEAKAAFDRVQELDPTYTERYEGDQFILESLREMPPARRRPF